MLAPTGSASDELARLRLERVEHVLRQEPESNDQDDRGDDE